MEHMMNCSTMLQGASYEAGVKIREKSKNCYGHMSQAHMLVTGSLGSALARRDGKLAEIKENSQKQIVLIAAFEEATVFAAAKMGDGSNVRCNDLFGVNSAVPSTKIPKICGRNPRTTVKGCDQILV